MNVIFRVDASINIGSGHVMRCLTLAQQLQKEKNARVYFISRVLEGNLIDFIKEKGFEVKTLSKNDKVLNNLEGYQKWLTVSQQFDVEQTIQILTDLDISIDLLVIDSYAIDIEWENKIRPYVKKIMVIDDLANRKHDCDILLDQNYSENMFNKYNGLVPDNCELRIGPKYLLLRDEFYKVKKNIKHRTGNINNILVFFGGIDFTNETLKTIKALSKIDKKDLIINVVVGCKNQYKNEIEIFCKKDNRFIYHCQVNNMAELMNQADISIGAAGATTWERCFLHLPSIVISVAENQEKDCEFLSKKNFFYYLGRFNEINENDIKNMLNSIDKLKIINMIDCIKEVFL